MSGFSDRVQCRNATGAAAGNLSARFQHFSESLKRTGVSGRLSRPIRREFEQYGSILFERGVARGRRPIGWQPVEFNQGIGNEDGCVMNERRERGELLAL